MEGKLSRKIKIFSLIILSLLFSVLPINTINTYANSFFSSNDVLFYDGTDCYSSPIISTISTSSGYDRLKQAVSTYGEIAMEMQREYGIPWEIVFAQMQIESQVGTAGIAISGANNNWLGITGEGDAGSWTGSGGRKWAIYSSVEASIKDWAGPRVLRNGYYDAAFQYLNPNSYDLRSFVSNMVSVYAPASDGNNVPAYIENVLSIINGPITAARTEKGWPSSAELAKKETISIGGKNPLTSTVKGIAYVNNGCLSPGNGDINRTAISLAWPDRTHSLNDPRAEYTKALQSVGLSNYGDHFVEIGASCDAFVATVMRYSGIDKDFICCGATNQLNYLSTSSKYREIPNLGNSSNLQPGDIFVISKIINGDATAHIMMYVVLEDGSGKIASASYKERTADYGVGVFFSDHRGEYRIFRYISQNV